MVVRNTVLLYYSLSVSCPSGLLRVVLDSSIGVIAKFVGIVLKFDADLSSGVYPGGSSVQSTGLTSFLKEIN